MLPIDVLYLRPIKHQPDCVSSMGDRWGALLEALDDVIQYYHHTSNYSSQTTLHYVDTDH